LIVFHCEEISKANFLDKAEVKQTVRMKVRCGEIVCALCSGLITIHSCYSRHCIDETGELHNGWIAQGHCAACNVYPALIPSFIKPRKHYKADVIERVIKGAEAGDNIERSSMSAADISTMRRWVREWVDRAERAVSCLISKLPTARRKEYVGLHDFQYTTLLQQLALLLDEYSVQESGGVIDRANVILTTHNCGFL